MEHGYICFAIAFLVAAVLYLIDPNPNPNPTSSVDSILSQTGQDCEITLLVLVNLSINGNRLRTY